jgi:outer membrane protein assembly factor BamB
MLQIFHKEAAVKVTSRCFHWSVLGAATLSWALLLNSQASAQWPQWRGPNRDGISSETGLLKTWPEDGPQVLWRIPAGEGFAGIAVAAGRAYTLFGQGDDEFVVCLEASSGKELWRFRADTIFTESHGNGPRSTPTVEGDRVFGLSTKGKLYALNSTSGEKVWQRDFVAEFGSSVPSWGFSTSPLVEGELLLVEVGGAAGKSIVAFDKKSGDVVWTSHTDKPAYSSPVATTFNDTRQILFMTASHLVGVAPADGQVYWKYPWSAHGGINVATPILVPGDQIFLSAAYDYGAVLLKMKAADGGIGVEEVWRSKVMKNHFNSSVLHEGYLYGFDNAILKCIEANTGANQWEARGFGKGSLTLADGHLIVLGEEGKLGLIEVSPEAYKEKASAQVLEGRCWTVPTLAGGKLYLRNGKEMICLDVTG